jgi:hypothetical protein
LCVTTTTTAAVSARTLTLHPHPPPSTLTLPPSPLIPSPSTLTPQAFVLAVSPEPSFKHVRMSFVRFVRIEDAGTVCNGASSRLDPADARQQVLASLLQTAFGIAPTGHFPHDERVGGVDTDYMWTVAGSPFTTFYRNSPRSPLQQVRCPLSVVCVCVSKHVQHQHPDFVGA